MVGGAPEVCGSQSENLWPIVSEPFYIYNINIYYQHEHVVWWRNQSVATACLADTGFIMTFTETPRDPKPGFGVPSVARVKRPAV